MLVAGTVMALQVTLGFATRQDCRPWRLTGRDFIRRGPGATCGSTPVPPCLRSWTAPPRQGPKFDMLWSTKLDTLSRF